MHLQSRGWRCLIKCIHCRIISAATPCFAQTIQTRRKAAFHNSTQEENFVLSFALRACCNNDSWVSLLGPSSLGICTSNLFCVMTPHIINPNYRPAHLSITMLHALLTAREVISSQFSLNWTLSSNCSFCQIQFLVAVHADCLKGPRWASQLACDSEWNHILSKCSWTTQPFCVYSPSKFCWIQADEVLENDHNQQNALCCQPYRTRAFAILGLSVFNVWIPTWSQASGQNFLTLPGRNRECLLSSLKNRLCFVLTSASKTVA